MAGGGAVNPAAPAIVIRPMTIDDVNPVRSLETEIFSQPWSERIFHDELGAHDRIYLVAAVEETIVGYGGAMVVVEDAHITTLAVDPEARRLRVATRVVLAIVERALEMGARHLTLEVRMSNRGAQRLYGEFGLAPVGVRKHYYRDEDALIMWATDIDGPDYAARLQGIRHALAGVQRAAG